uniref:Uncharacterized protein n=1 Tax=Myoviridae sp. ctwwN25 TaxID=2825209 RepID=A0A8S5PNC5_9CAUD|nr:MAG TPA: hypothetical protein [Myoviridae sp. ctwwN25]
MILRSLSVLLCLLNSRYYNTIASNRTQYVRIMLVDAFSSTSKNGQISIIIDEVFEKCILFLNVRI